MSKPFLAPKIELGSVVLWYADGIPENGSAPTPAVVLACGDRAVQLGILEQNSNVLRLRTCRHVSDPDMQKVDVRNEGGWDYGPLHKRIQEVEEDMKILKQAWGDFNKKR